MKKKRNVKEKIFLFVLITLIFSIFYSVTRIIIAPENAIEMPVGTHIKSDYVLMLLQCCLGLVVLGLPSVLEKRFSFKLPNYMCIIYFIFLYCSIYLGDVRNFYYLIPHWDSILHCFSGAMLGAFGFSLVDILNHSEKVKIDLSPVFVCLFAFCFAIAAGVIWEIYEFTGDSLFGLNMQKHRLQNGTMLIGQEALKDTMIDLIVDAAGALIVIIGGLISEKIKENKNKEN